MIEEASFLMIDRKQRRFSTVEELTKLAVPEAHRIELTYTNLPGLRLAVQPSGRCKWVYSYVGSDKKRHKVQMGAYPVDAPIKERRKSLRAAFTRAIEYNTQVEDVEADDPHVVVAEKAKAREQKARAATRKAEADEWTVRKLGDTYLSALKSEGRRSSTTEGYQQRLEKWVYPQVGDKAAANVTDDDIVDVLRELRENGNVRQYNLVRQVVQGMYNWAAGRTPMSGKQPPKHLRRMPNPTVPIPVWKVKRAGSKGARAFTPSELPVVWTALKRHRGDADLDAMALMLLTGCRIGETRRARWEDIDLGAATWTIPATVTKGGREHVVYLSSQAVELLESRPRDKSGNVFSRIGFVDGVIGEQTGYKRLKDIMRLEGLDPTGITSHSCRKTVGTFVQPRHGADVRLRVLNQRPAPGLLTDEYVKYRYDDEAKAAWQDWANHLDQVEWQVTEAKLDQAILAAKRRSQTTEESAA